MMKESLAKKIGNYNATPVALVVYAVWWIYVIYFIYFKEFDNNAAEADASIGVGIMTVWVIMIYLLGFTVAWFKDKPNSRLYILGLILTLLPIPIVLLIEYLK